MMAPELVNSVYLGVTLPILPREQREQKVLKILGASRAHYDRPDPTLRLSLFLGEHERYRDP
jgi:hypothetical protein